MQVLSNPGNDSSGKPNLPYDKIKLIACNNNYLFACSCTNILYYTTLTNGQPNDTPNWQTVQIGNDLIPNSTLNITKMNINNNYI